MNSFSYAVGGSYANNVNLTGADTSTIDVAANGALSAYSVGTLTFGAGSPDDVERHRGHRSKRTVV